MSKSWFFALDRRLIELTKAKKSLEEAASVMERTPKCIRKVAMRLGIKFSRLEKRRNGERGQSASPISFVPSLRRQFSIR
jgi:hypothetical protein